MQETFPAPEPGTGFGDNLDEATKAYGKGLQVAHSQLAVPEGNIQPWEQHPSAEIVTVIEGVFLGARRRSDGIGSTYIDEYYEPVPDAGIQFGVEQASYGFTGISAKPLEGYKVEALTEDKETKAISWVGSADKTEEVRVTGDWGKMNIPIEQYLTTNFGNEGGRAGIVRVTDPDGHQKYYALGADFKGEPDKWRVKGSMVEIFPHDMPALVARKLGLPSAKEGAAIPVIEKTPPANETPLQKAQRLFALSTTGENKYDNLLNPNINTEEAIGSLSQEDRKRFDQWMIDRARS